MWHFESDAALGAEAAGLVSPAHTAIASAKIMRNTAAIGFSRVGPDVCTGARFGVIAPDALCNSQADRTGAFVKVFLAAGRRKRLYRLDGSKRLSTGIKATGVDAEFRARPI